MRLRDQPRAKKEKKPKVEEDEEEMTPPPDDEEEEAPKPKKGKKVSLHPFQRIASSQGRRTSDYELKWSSQTPATKKVKDEEEDDEEQPVQNKKVSFPLHWAMYMFAG